MATCRKDVRAEGVVRGTDIPEPGGGWGGAPVWLKLSEPGERERRGGERGLRPL